MSLVKAKITHGLEGNPLAKLIRNEVFVKEQGFHNEFDEIDPIAYHVVLFEGDKPIGTGRCFPDKNNKDQFHIGRVAVLKEFRKKNYGKIIMDNLEEQIKKVGGKSIILSAQVRASKFYSKLGYTFKGEEYFDEYCPHIDMVKKI